MVAALDKSNGEGRRISVVTWVPRIGLEYHPGAIWRLAGVRATADEPDYSERGSRQTSKHVGTLASPARITLRPASGRAVVLTEKI